MSKQKKQTPQPTNKQVANSNVGYQGVVTITTYKGKQRKSHFSQKNAGKQPLFNFLVSCLNGQFQENNRPNFIQLFGSARSDLTAPFPDNFNKLTGLIKATKATIEGENGSANITYSFLVPYYMLTTDDSLMYIYRAQLLNRAGNVCAQVDIEVPKGFARPFLDKSRPDYSLIIDWKLSISNIANTEDTTPTPTEEGEQ